MAQVIWGIRLRLYGESQGSHGREPGRHGAVGGQWDPPRRGEDPQMLWQASGRGARPAARTPVSRPSPSSALGPHAVSTHYMLLILNHQVD